MLSRASKAIAKLGGLVAVTACSVIGGPSAPEPDYTVLLSEPPFELRDYGELVVAKTSRTDGSNAAFRRLFNYISGRNEGARKIAMTAPVLNTDAKDGAKIPMTAPVLQTGADAREMVFVLPENFTLDTAPVPSDPRVSLGTIPPRRVAVVRYPGALEARAAEEETRLREWMAEKDLQPAGPAEVAGYNPPWTLPAYRRNEVLIPVARR